MCLGLLLLLPPALLTNHGVGLARPCGTISEHCAIEPLDHACCQVCNAALVHILVGGLQHTAGDSNSRQLTQEVVTGHKW